MSEHNAIEKANKVNINRLGGGLLVPVNVLLFQEIHRLQNVLGKVGFMLK